MQIRNFVMSFKLYDHWRFLCKETQSLSSADRLSLSLLQVTHFLEFTVCGFPTKLSHL